eukprot:2285628-Amphidinium_carterae.1
MLQNPAFGRAEGRSALHYLALCARQELLQANVKSHNCIGQHTFPQPTLTRVSSLPNDLPSLTLCFRKVCSAIYTWTD